MPLANGVAKATVTLDVPIQRLRDLLTSALEGGSNYWYTINLDRTIYAPGLSYEDFQEGGRCTDPKRYHHPLEIIPFMQGCALCVEDKLAEGDEQKEYWLGRNQLLAGVQVMAEKYPRHFNDMVVENDDADTGDIYLQCCIFGEALYG